MIRTAFDELKQFYATILSMECQLRHIGKDDPLVTLLSILGEKDIEISRHALSKMFFCVRNGHRFSLPELPYYYREVGSRQSSR